MPPDLEYKTPEEFHDKCKEFFSKLEKTECPTITGLALYLGFCSRQSLYDYGKRDRFSYVVKWARLMVESGYERMLHGNAPTGAIFVLKNMGWSDSKQIDLSSSDKSMSPRNFNDFYNDEEEE